MKSPTIEQRVAALEQELSKLKSQKRRERDWRRTIGIFTDQPEMKELFAEAMKLREADRRRTRRKPPKRPDKA